MKKLLSCLMSLVFAAGVAFAGTSNQNAGNNGMSHPFKMEKKNKKSFDTIAKELNLTDEQKKKIEDLGKTNKEKIKEIRKQIKEKNKAINDELLKENYNVNTVNGLAAEIQQLQGSIEKIRIDGKVQIRSILTYDQFKQMETKKKEKIGNKNGKNNVNISSSTAKTAGIKAAKNFQNNAAQKSGNKNVKNFSKIKK